MTAFAEVSQPTSILCHLALLMGVRLREADWMTVPIVAKNLDDDIGASDGKVNVSIHSGRDDR